MSRIFSKLSLLTSSLIGLSLLATPGAALEVEDSFEQLKEGSSHSSQLQDWVAQATPEYADPDAALGILKNRPKLQVPGNGLINEAPNTMSQVTSVSELRDVEPTEWAYEALRSLVERYGCIVGYPDRTFRGDRSLTRWEFAAGLNACMNVMERLIQENVAVLREDIEKLKQLAEQFQAELAVLGTRVDNLESRVAFLEDHQFSTTTKLTGEVVIALTGIAGGSRNQGTEDIPRVPTLGHRTRVELNTSFTGEDTLYTRLATGTIADLTETAGTFEAATGFAQPDGSDVAVEVLFYEFPIGDYVTVFAEAAGGAFDDFTSTFNIFDGDGATGAISAFGTRNPIYYQGEGTGLGLTGSIGSFEWSAGYLAPDGPDPTEGNGLFNGAYGSIAQVAYVPSENFGLAFTFAHGFNTLDTGTGSTLSNFQFFSEDTFGEAVSTSHNSYGLTFSWQIFDQFVLGGWGGYTSARTLDAVENDDLGTLSRGSLDIWQWAVTLGFPDAFSEGDLAGIVVGMQPWVSSSSPLLPNGQRINDGDSSLHLEGFYQYAISDNISITPGIIVITAPDSSDDNDTLVIGTIRTTFTF